MYALCVTLPESLLTYQGTSTGRKCDGYLYEPSPVCRKPANHVQIFPSLTTSPCHDYNECRFLQHFQERTAIELAGPFRDELWLKFVLQVAHQEPSIQHAVFALSGYHENFCNPRRNESVEPASALRQYNLAIKSLVKPGTGPSSNFVQLLSCLIFFCIEVRLLSCALCWIYRNLGRSFEAITHLLFNCSGRARNLSDSFSKTARICPKRQFA